MNQAPIESSVHTLLIEDNQDDQCLIALALAGERPLYAIERYSRLDAALARLAVGGVDLILLDLSLPDSHGIETFHRIHDAARGVPIVVLSGNTDEDLAVRAVQLGAQDYILKGELARSSLTRSLRYARERHRAARQLEEQRAQLMHASRMATLGEISAAIAHEINNPLTVIHCMAQALRPMLAREPLDLVGVDSMLDRIMKMTRRLSDITSALRGFARDAARDPVVLVPVRELLRDTLELCQERFKAGSIELRADDPPLALAVDCRPPEIAQLLLNLLNNSFDAVAELTERWVRVEVQDAGDEVVLRVVDSGKGLTEGIRHQALMPFFTTKAAGKGLGLGLYIAARIAEKHGGELHIDANSSHTCFVLTLPKPDRPMRMRQPMPSQSRASSL